MGEELVLGRLTIDRQDIIRGFSEVDGSIDKSGRRLVDLERTTIRTSNAFTARMFSMRSAVVAFLGSITLAGTILEFKNFLGSVAALDPKMKELSETAARVGTAFQKMFAPIVRAGIVDATVKLSLFEDALSGIITGFQSKFRSMGAGEKAAFLTILTLLGGPAGVGAFGGVVGQGAGGPGVGLLPQERGALRTGGAPFGGLGELNVPAAPGARPPSGPFIPQAIRIPESLDTLGDLHAEIVDMFQPVEELALGFEDLSESMGQIREQDIGPVFEEEILPILDEAAAKLDIMTSAATAFGQAFSSALFEAGTSLKEALAEQLTALARAMTAYALTSVALGALASTPWGAAVLGPAPPYFKAAALFGIAAAGAYGVAAAFGGGRGGNQRDAVGGTAVAAAGAGGGGRTININVNGSIVGSDPNQIADWIQDVLDKRATD